MKKLTVKKNGECMACLECVRACSTAFYKEFDPDLSCIQIVAKVWVNKSDYWPVKFLMNERIYQEFPKNGINFPYQKLDINILNQNNKVTEE